MLKNIQAQANPAALMQKAAKSTLRAVNGSNSRKNFSTEWRRALNAAPGIGRLSGQNLSTARTTAAPHQISPFHPPGLPVDNTPAPTAADVAANPARWAGTSFDPNRGVTPLIHTIRALEDADARQAGCGFNWHAPQQPVAEPPVYTPPQGSIATGDPNVFVTPFGNTWHRPATVPVHQTSEDYNRWRIATFGPFPA